MIADRRYTALGILQGSIHRLYESDNFVRPYPNVLLNVVDIWSNTPSGQIYDEENQQYGYFDFASPSSYFTSVSSINDPTFTFAFQMHDPTVEWGDNSYLKVYLRLQNDSNHYYLKIRGQNVAGTTARIELRRKIADVDTLLKDFTTDYAYDFDLNRWNLLTVQIADIGSQITIEVILNGQNLGAFTETEQLTYGWFSMEPVGCTVRWANYGAYNAHGMLSQTQTSDLYKRCFPFFVTNHRISAYTNTNRSIYPGLYGADTHVSTPNGRVHSISGKFLQYYPDYAKGEHLVDETARLGDNEVLSEAQYANTRYALEQLMVNYPRLWFNMPRHISFPGIISNIKWPKYNIISGKNVADFNMDVIEFWNWWRGTW